MKSLILKYQRIIDSLSPIAKSAILFTILSITFIVWYYSLWENLHHSRATTSNKIKVIKQYIPKLTHELQTIENTIKTQRKKTDKNRATTPSRLLSPHQTNEVLYNLLTTTNNLTLIHLENTPPKMLFLPQSNLKIFDHGITIKFQGDYFSVMRYLQAIESLKWKIFWDKLEYKVLQYPIAEITLYIHTVSNYEDWIDA